MPPTPPHKTRTSNFRFGRTKPICGVLQHAAQGSLAGFNYLIRSGPKQPLSLAHGETKSPRPGSSYSFGRTNPICPSGCQRDAIDRTTPILMAAANEGMLAHRDGSKGVTNFARTNPISIRAYGTGLARKCSFLPKRTQLDQRKERPRLPDFKFEQLHHTAAFL
jgi:hypothetical protein